MCKPLILLVFTQLCIFFKCQSFSHVKSFPQFELHQNLYITYIKICWVFLSFFFFFNATMGTPSFALVQAGGVRWESRAQTCWHFPGGPVVKTSPSNAGDEGSIPGRGAKMPHSMQRGQEVKKKRRRKRVPLELSELARGVCP